MRLSHLQMRMPRLYLSSTTKWYVFWCFIRLFSDLTELTRRQLGLRRQGTPPPNTTLYSTTNRDWGKTRNDLLSLLPPQSTLETLSSANSCWWLLRAQCFQDHDTSLLSSSRADFLSRHPAVIAKALLWVAICLQQLPRGFDISSLELPCAPARLIERCVNIVAQSVCSDEALVSSIDGLECLVIQGIFYNNDGKL